MYRARHLQTGQEAALKTLTRPSASARRALRREIAALGELDHPGIVSLVDADPDVRDPWYAMELLQGLTLRRTLGALPRAASTWVEGLATGGAETWIEPLPAGPFSRFDDAAMRRLALIAQLAHALGHVHAAGLVHCDLKPDNVLVVRGRAVLVDFGLVSAQRARTDPAALIEGSGVAGTAAYMSPERARGQLYDARADLYALGCLLYEVLSGRPPFLGTSVLTLLRAHMSEPPLPLSERVEDLPAALSELVEGLLQKEPAGRIGHVQRVLHVLDTLGIPIPRAPLPATPPLYQSGLRGRTAALTTLLGEAKSARRGCSRAVWLLGESGSGKSRLAAELVARCKEIIDPIVLVGRCSALATTGTPVPSGIPLEAFVGPLRHAADLACEDPRIARGLAESGSLLVPFVPSLAAVPGLAELPVPQLDRVEAGRARLHRAVVDALSAVAGALPVILILDDLQWADELSVGTLAYLLRSTGDRPWLVVGLLRSEADDTHLEELLGLGTVVDLERLSPGDVGGIVTEMLGQQPPGPLLGWIERHATGNPFFVGECLRAAVADGFLALGSNGRWGFSEPTTGALDARPMPDSVEALISSRLTGLDPHARHVAQASAVLGARAPLELLREVVERPEGLDDALERLDRRAIAHVREHPAGATVSFEHDRLVELAYASLGVEERRELHERCALALDRAAGDPAQLGWHRERAGQQQQARAAYLDAAVAAAQRYALSEAEHSLEQVLRLTDRSDVVAVARIQLLLAERVLLPQARTTDIIAALSRSAAALGDDAPPDVRAHVLLLLGQAQVTRHDEAGLPTLARCLALAEAQDLPGIAAQALSATANEHFRRGDPELGVSLQRCALARLPDDAPLELFLQIRKALARLYMQMARTEECLELLSSILEDYRERGMIAGEASTQGILADTLTIMGRHDEAQAHYEQALTLHRRVGNRVAEARLLNNLGGLYRRTARTEEGFALIERALRMNEALGQHRMVGIGKRAMGLRAMRAGRLEEALQIMCDARRSLEILSDARWCAHMDQAIGRTLRFLRRFDEAADALERACRAYEQLGAKVEHADALLQWVHLAIARGDDPRPWADQIEALADDLGPDAESYVGEALDNARELISCWRSGEPLLLGDFVEWMSDELRGRLEAEARATGAGESATGAPSAPPTGSTDPPPGREGPGDASTDHEPASSEGAGGSQGAAPRLARRALR